MEIDEGSNRCAYEHAVSEIHIPGSTGDDQEKFPTFPVANGDVKEAKKTISTASEDGDTTVTNANITADKPEDLITTIDEVAISSERSAVFLSDEDAYPTDSDGLESRNAESSTPVSIDRDYWSIQGDYLVRTHKVPRTTLFTPLEVPNEPPPIAINNIEVLRTTKPRFSGTQWPTMEIIEDCWTARPSDAKPLLAPSDGSTLTWTGETVFERVLPKPPKGKVWCGTELVRHRAGTRRAQDIHPLHWWLMSTSARLNAATNWKQRYKDIVQAQSRRVIPREELDVMPKANNEEYMKNPTGASIMVLGEIDTDDVPDLVHESSDEETSDN